MKRYSILIQMVIGLMCMAGAGAMNMDWVYISDPGVSGHEGFSGYMSKYETTNAQYCQFLNAAKASSLITVFTDNKVYATSDTSHSQPYFATFDASSSSQITYSGGVFNVRSRDGYSMTNHPVVMVSWYGATAFCDYYGYRLPTEWEWQAVADYDGSYTYGCGTSISPSKANYWPNYPLALTSSPYTSPVGFYSAYGYGLCDMAGNVWEWTSSIYDVSSYAIRGGSWGDSDGHCAISYQGNYDPTISPYDGGLGFRVCMGLIAHYKLDDTYGAVIDETGNHDGTNYGAIRGLTGAKGKAFSFDGVDNYVDTVPPTNIPLVLSVSMWVFPTKLTGGMQIWGSVEDASGGKDGYVSSYSADSHYVSFSCVSGNIDRGSIYSSVDSVPSNKWSFLTFTVDSLKNAKIYVNGVKNGSGTFSALPTAHDKTLMIGKSILSQHLAFKGTIDDVRIYDCALSGNEIQALYTSAFTDYHVDTNHGSNSNDGLTRETAFATVQHGIDQSDDLDTINVWPGVYNETVDFLGKAITVQSAADAAVITYPAGYGMRFHTAEDASSVLKNFVIRDCLIGIQVESSSPMINNVTVVGNTQAIVADGVADPNIANSIVWDNASGGLIDCDASYSWVQNQLVDNISGLVAYYPLEGTADDASGNGYNGTINGAVSTEGKCGDALSFDGVSQYVSTGMGNGYTFNEITMSAWIYYTENRDASGIICSRSGGEEDVNYGALNLGYQTQTPSFNIQNIGYATSSEGTVQKNQWVMLTGTYDGSTFKIYVNGELKGTGSGTGSWIPGADFEIGRDNTKPWESARWFKGKIDEASIYNRALSESEIQQQYARGNSGYGAGDPIFANPGQGDYHLRSQDGRFFPVPVADPNTFGGADGAWVMDAVTSPCVDAGNPEDNPSAERMPNGGRVNMGAYGGTAYASMSEYPIQGDINRDGVVNLGDMAILSMDWLKALPWVD